MVRKVAPVPTTVVLTGWVTHSADGQDVAPLLWLFEGRFSLGETGGGRNLERSGPWYYYSGGPRPPVPMTVARHRGCGVTRVVRHRGCTGFWGTMTEVLPRSVSACRTCPHFGGKAGVGRPPGGDGGQRMRQIFLPLGRGSNCVLILCREEMFLLVGKSFLANQQLFLFYHCASEA